ncbi:MAG: AbrB/MazE/SpoVT family DNA-binding domain-containing protein [Oscillospiraceae bacterium]|jgi:AbrB family looped-hinge helix DNA binding protein|nr:AbrB/MazE/SpoVT family DNA-binding domain-containing protein [Oscillospiraceae bacterium]MCI1990041.1 AbrB/MazE/SpoVT family DNA-binding domain-containing protein [Oscillospiraceae bacterium]MCI2034787.1 AbrB/MazE/SpoVT family DNA-binding domain-containing protein [Oscillospiraceae bacterium]
MKSTGIVRKIDNLGRIVLPKELRRVLHLPEGTPMEISVDGSRIVLQKYQAGGAWSADELKEALIAAAKDSGKDPVYYLDAARKEGKTI